MTTEQAKQLDIVIYLEHQNIRPVKVTGHQYWYYSPFREERTPSFKVNRLFNLWYDFGENKGGNLIDLGIRLESCTVKDFLVLLHDNHVVENTASSFGQQRNNVNTNNCCKPAIKILSTHLISSYHLTKYLQQRKINSAVADEYLSEVCYQNKNKIYYALGFKNNLGGYELRSPFFKGASSPKAVTFFDNNASELTVFEGFFDFLSYLCLRQQNEHQYSNYLVLNSVAFFERQLSFMQQFKSIHLYLDNDNAGDKATALAASSSGKKFVDERGLYKDYKDFSEWWMLHPPS